MLMDFLIGQVMISARPHFVKYKFYMSIHIDSIMWMEVYKWKQ